MARNDVVLIDGIMDDRVATKRPSSNRDEAFEFFAVEQVLKEFDLSAEQILAGIIDGRGDGGIDAFYIFVNGHLLTDPDDFPWPRTGAELAVHLVSSKHHDTFKMATVEALFATLTELFDLSIPDGGLSSSYSESLRQARALLVKAYRALSPRLRQFSVDVHYVSRGDTDAIGPEVLARAVQVERLIVDYFGASCKANFRLTGSRELVEMHRRMPSYCLNLTFESQLSRGERYVVLAKLADYCRFVTDNGQLRRYLFDSNVRDFMGLNRTNEDIGDTLRDLHSPDFWWLNNGVTILATSASIVGNSIQLSDVQIVNGLQTTESIFRYFEAGAAEVDERCVLVKVIVSQDPAVRDAIIRATNNQTAVELSSLHATDRIQRDIEEAFTQQGMAYERRSNHYLYQGHSKEVLTTPMYLAAGSVAILLRMVNKAPGLKSRFMRNPKAYELVFSDSIPLTTWPALARILKRVDECLELLRPSAQGTDRFLKERRYIVAYLILSRFAKTFVVTPQHIEAFPIDCISKDSVRDLLTLISRTGQDAKSRWQSKAWIVEACRLAATEFRINNIEALIGAPNHWPQGSYTTHPAVSLSAKMVDKVRNELPPQPWKPGMHLGILEKLPLSAPQLRAAINELIQRGVVFQQRNGVLYNLDGEVVGHDPERVDPNTLKLR